MTSRQDEIRRSKWLELLHKDVECTFGIMKGRWRILKAGGCIWGVLKADDVWLTCCTLHNWLLDIDGFGGVWNGGLPISDWTGPLGDMEFDGVREDIPNAIARLGCNLDPHNYNSSGMGHGSNVISDEVIPHNRVSGLLLHNSISLMSLTHFQKKLVEHHAVQFSKNTVIWPTYD
jgi:hypothetical protein